MSTGNVRPIVQTVLPCFYVHSLCTSRRLAARGRSFDKLIISLMYILCNHVTKLLPLHVINPAQLIVQLKQSGQF